MTTATKTDQAKTDAAAAALRHIITRVLLPRINEEARRHLSIGPRGTSVFARRVRDAEMYAKLLPPRPAGEVGWPVIGRAFLANPQIVSPNEAHLLILGTATAVSNDIFNAWYYALIDASYTKHDMQVLSPCFLNDAMLPGGESGQQTFAKELAGGMTNISVEEAAEFLRMLRSQLPEDRSLPKELEAFLSLEGIVCLG